MIRIIKTAPAFIGLSTDTKPTGDGVQPGSTFLETDTGFISTFDGVNWQVSTNVAAAPLTVLTLTLGLWKEMQETNLAILDEVRATRLAASELVNAGTPDQTDFLEMSQLVRDADEEG